MRAGPLRHQVVMQQPANGSPNAYGERPVTWSTFATVQASIEPANGREFDYGKTFAATVSHVIGIRYLAGVSATFRVVYSGRYFYVNAIIDPDERRRELKLYCTENAA